MPKFAESGALPLIDGPDGRSADVGIDQPLYMIFLSLTGDLFNGCMAAHAATEKDRPLPRRSLGKHQIHSFGPTRKFTHSGESAVYGLFFFLKIWNHLLE